MVMAHDSNPQSLQLDIELAISSPRRRL